MLARFAVALLFAATGGCTPPDRSISSPDGRFTLQLRAPRLRPQTYQPPGWAELYGPFGLFCGKADFFGDALAAQVRWDANSVTVDGVRGSWSLEPCGFLAPPAPPDPSY
jgi:hypothetical protein